MAGLVQATWSIVAEETGAEEWRALRRIEGRVGVNSKGLDFSPLHEATKPNGTRCEKNHSLEKHLQKLFILE